MRGGGEEWGRGGGGGEGGKGGGEAGGGGESGKHGRREGRRRRDTGDQTKHNQGAKRNTIRRSGCDYQSAGGPDWLLLVVILFIATDVIIAPAKTIPGDARQEA